MKRPLVGIGLLAFAGMLLAQAQIRRPLLEAKAAAALITDKDSKSQTSPLKPEEALRSFETEPGLGVELAAAEPLLADPVAVCWDERGRMFVAENRGYPTGGPAGKASGVIAMLEDADGDGRCDQRTEFATGLTYPNGLQPWRGGLIVTCAPDVFYLKDTNGDGQADVKEILLTGFATNQSTQLRVNKPMLAPDGWVHLASGLSWGEITSPKRPQEKPLQLKGDVRFKPDTGEYQHIDGKSQFGQSFDDFGRRFGVFNRVQVQHFVLPSRYVERNPHLASPGVLQNCPKLIGNPLMRGGGGAVRIYPISANITTADSHAGTFSAACAIHIWRGGSLPEGYNGQALTCDPTGNLVHRDRLVPSGATFSARRIGENIELLRSRDNWFRPVYLANGPDGALYICDMYRKVIEHPEYLPVEVRKRTDFESGKGMGRLWRVAAAGKSQAKRKESSLAGASVRELVAELESANAWRRDTAFRLLLERREPTTSHQLNSGVTRSGSTPAIVARLHLRELIGALDETMLLGALGSSEPGVREVALKLAEPRAATSPKLQARILQLAGDPDSMVRFHCALAVGAFMRATGSVDPILQALASIATHEDADKWTRAAAVSSISGRERDFLTVLLKHSSGATAATSALLRDLGGVMSGAVPPSEHAALLSDVLAEPGLNFEVASAWLAGFAETRSESVRSFAASGKPGAERLKELFALAKTQVADVSGPLSRRLQAASLLISADDQSINSVLLDLLRAGEASELQLAAIRILTQARNADGAGALLAANRWPGYTPALRGAVLGSLLGRPEHHAALLDAIESGVVPVGVLNSSQREQLRKSKNDSLRQRAGKLFASATSGDRMKAFEEAKASLALQPAPGNGREVFKRLCASCHRLDRDGVAVGPDLFDIRNQSKESILMHIVIPEQEVAPNFANYNCELKNGRVLSGLIAAESASSVTLRQAAGLEETILREQIASLTASTLSLMPQELEKGLSAQELADLLGYLKAGAD